MEGEDLENINAAVRKVSYINSRQFPTPGIRRLHISTAVQYVTRFFSFSSSLFFQLFLLYSFSNFLFPYICFLKSSPVVSISLYLLSQIWGALTQPDILWGVKKTQQISQPDWYIILFSHIDPIPSFSHFSLSISPFLCCHFPFSLMCHFLFAVATGGQFLHFHVMY